MSAAVAEKYAPPAILLHWAIALLLVGSAGLGLALEEIPREQRGVWANLHGVIGLSVMLLTFARLAVRRATPPPPLVDRAWVVTGSKLAHGLLYALTLALPLTGLAMWWLRGRGLDLWLFQIPTPFAADRAAAGQMEGVHKALFLLTAVIVAGHVAAALVHQFVWKDGLLDRMRPRGSATPR